MATEPMFTPLDLLVEQMGDALFELSDSLRGQLENDPQLGARYEKVVVAWRGLTSALAKACGVSDLRDGEAGK